MILLPAIQAPPMSIPPASQSWLKSSELVLVTLRIIRAGILLNTEKSNKIDRYNLTVYVNIYHEENACIPYIVEKAMQNMDEENLVLVGPNGLILYRQVGTGT